jgi:hypothetical protein
MKSVKPKIGQNFRESSKPLEKMSQLLNLQPQRKAEQKLLEKMIQSSKNQQILDKLKNLERKPQQTRRLTQKPRLSAIRKSRMMYSGMPKAKLPSKKVEEPRYEDLYPLLKDVYYTHHDGTRPYRVSLVNNVAHIEVDANLDSRNDFPVPRWNRIMDIPYINVFIGNDHQVNRGNPMFFGNSILLQNTPGKYTYIGATIYEFISDQIYVFESPVGGSDVSYPYAYTKYRTLLLWESVSFPTVYNKIPEDVHYEYIKKNQKFKIKPIGEKVTHRPSKYYS